MDTIKNQLAEAEKSLKVQEDEICAKFAELNAKDLKLHAKDAELHDKDAKLHAKDVKIQAANAELGRKDKHIQTLKEDAANAVKKDQKSNEYENLMEQWFQMGYNASHSQGSSLHAYEYWPPLEPVSGCEPKQTFETQVIRFESRCITST